MAKKSQVNTGEQQATQQNAALEQRTPVDEAEQSATTKFSYFARQGFRELSDDVSGDGA